MQTPDPILAASANGTRFWPGSTPPPQSSTLGGKRHSSGSALPPLESASAVGEFHLTRMFYTMRIEDVIIRDVLRMSCDIYYSTVLLIFIFIFCSSGITNGLGDLSLTQQCAPPPGKIRRRNALPTSDLFLQSRELQRLQGCFTLSQTLPMGNGEYNMERHAGCTSS